MTARLPRTLGLAACLLVVVGCNAIRRHNREENDAQHRATFEATMRSAVGTLTYDEALSSWGPPTQTEKRLDGGWVSSWITQQDIPPTPGIPPMVPFNNGSMSTSMAQSYNAATASRRYGTPGFTITDTIIVTFDADGIMRQWVNRRN